jgi:hypothetical protein
MLRRRAQTADATGLFDDCEACGTARGVSVVYFDGHPAAGITPAALVLCVVDAQLAQAAGGFRVARHGALGRTLLNLYGTAK